MCDLKNALRDLYSSDIILNNEETEMLEQVDTRFFELIDRFYEHMEHNKISLNESDLEEIEQSVSEYCFEYGFVQFKRGIRLMLAMLKA